MKADDEGLSGESLRLVVNVALGSVLIVLFDLQRAAPEAERSEMAAASKLRANSCSHPEIPVNVDVLLLVAPPSQPLTFQIGVGVRLGKAADITLMF